MKAVLRDIDIDQDLEIGTTAPALLCIGGRTELDEAAAQLVVRLLDSNAVPARALAPLAIRQESIGQLALDGVQVVCLCYLGDNPRSYARFVAKRLLRHHPKLKVIVCAFGLRSNPDNLADWGVDTVVGTLAAAVTTLIDITRQAALLESDRLVQMPIDDAGLTRLRQLARSDGPLSALLGEIAVSAGVPVAIMDVTSNSLDASGRGVNTVSRRVIDENAPIFIPSVADSDTFANDPFLLENGVRFYAGVPLLGPDGRAIGALALLDHQARTFSKEDQDKLELQALRLMVEVTQMQTTLPV
jgi:GAF domain-containing protein